MPQLNDTLAQKVADAEDGFKLLDPGIYRLTLIEVEVKEGKKGPYWSWRFDVTEGEPNAGRRFYENTSLSEAAFFRLKSVFAAFGVPTGTDTEELIGRQLRGVVGHETIGDGPKMGELRNSLDQLLPKDGPVGTDEVTLKEAGVKVKVDVTKQDASDGSFKGGETEAPLF
jgi:hypothetical protein